jgi:hypothetical protein
MKFLDADAMATLTGHPVRSDYMETGRMLVAEDAALYRLEVISGADLVPAVA